MKAITKRVQSAVVNKTSSIANWCIGFLGRSTWLSRTLRRFLLTGMGEVVMCIFLFLSALIIPAPIFLFLMKLSSLGTAGPLLFVGLMSIYSGVGAAIVVFGATIYADTITFYEYFQDTDSSHDHTNLPPPGEDELLHQFKEMKLEVRLRELKEEAGIIIKRIMHYLRITPQPYPL